MEAGLLLAQPSPLSLPPSTLPCTSSLTEGHIRICWAGFFSVTQSKSGPVSLFVHHLVQTWGNLHFLFQGASFRNLSVDSLWETTLQEVIQNVEEKQLEGTIAFPLMVGCSEHMCQVRPVVHTPRFDSLIYVRSAQS